MKVTLTLIRMCKLVLKVVVYVSSPKLRSILSASIFHSYLQRMIETAPWGDDAASIEKQIVSHNRTLSSLQRSQEVDRARDDLVSGLIRVCAV